MEGVSQQIEQAKMFEDGCESENDNIKAAVAGTYAKNHSLFTVCRKACFRLNDVVKRLLFSVFFMAALWRWRGWCHDKAFGLAISRSQVQILLRTTLRNNLK